MKNDTFFSREDVVKLLSILLRNWYLVVVVPALAWAVAYLYAYKQQELYAATCQIMLKDEASFQSQFQEQFSKVSSTYSYEYTAGQMRVIKSSDLIESVLEDLSLDVRYFIVGRLKVSELYHHVPFKVEFDDRATASFGTRFNVKILSKDTYQLSYDSEAGNVEEEYAFDELVTQNGLHLKLSMSPDRFYKSLTELDYQFQIYPRSTAISKYKAAINVENLDYTSIIQVSLTDEIPSRATDFLSVLSEKYLQTTIQNQIEVNSNTQKYIDELLTEISGVVNGIENELDSFKVDRNIIDIGREETSLFERMAELELRKRSLEIELSALDEIAEYVLSSESLKMMMPPSVYLQGVDKQIMAQLDQLFDLKREYQEGLENVKPSNLRMQTVYAEMESKRKEILQYKEAQERAISKEIRQIEAELSVVEREIKFIPNKERELLNIEKKIKVNEGLYDYLLSRRAEVLIARAALVPQTKVIEVPRSIGVVYPDKMGFSLKASLGGVVLVIIIIFLREVFFRKIRNRHELEQVTSIPVLGSVPEDAHVTPEYLIQNAKDRGQVVQAFRAIRASLQYVPKQGNCHKILVTSLMPGEGKTFTSANIASVLALADKKVLVVDFDMHKPRLHKVFNLSRNVGLSNYLSKGVDLDETILKGSDHSCDVIPAGPVPPNASELVLQENVKRLFAYAEENYDYLIVDTPPTAVISDSIVLMSEVDTSIFVCSSRNTSRTSIDHIDKIISENGLIGVSLLLNKERRTKLDGYYAKYGYGGYGYGYGYEYKYVKD